MQQSDSLADGCIQASKLRRLEAPVVAGTTPDTHAASVSDSQCPTISSEPCCIPSASDRNSVAETGGGTKEMARRWTRQGCVIFLVPLVQHQRDLFSSEVLCGCIPPVSSPA